jgi:hypothetical protein
VTMRLLTAFEVVFMLVGLVGLAFLAGWPSALLVGGLIGVAACEAAARRREAPVPVPAPVGVPTDRTGTERMRPVQ